MPSDTHFTAMVIAGHSFCDGVVYHSHLTSIKGGPALNDIIENESSPGKSIMTTTLPSVQSLEKIALFRCLSPELIGRIQTLCTWKRYEPGEHIINYLDQSDEVFFISDGEARVSITSMQGKPVAFTDLDSGDIFGEVSAIDGGPRSVTVDARTSCCIASLPAAAFQEIVKSEPTFALELLQHLTKKIRVLITRVYYLCSLDVANRTRAELLRLAKLAPQEGNSALLNPMPTHAEIASRIGAHRESVTREFNRLSKLGLIERRDHAILVTNVEWLESTIHDATGD